MKLSELAREYRSSGALLKERIIKLEGQTDDESIPEMEKFRLRCRIIQLKRMYRYVNEAACAMEKYYDKRYRNGSFSI